MDGWLWDVEAALQFGRYATTDAIAGMATAGVGRRFSDTGWKPTVWVFYDFASGDEDPTNGTITTFNQLFPLSHKYFGWLDLVARQNVHDLNFQWYLYPTKKLNTLLWVHFLWLAEPQDGLYNAAGVVSRQDLAGLSGQEIGQEVDFAVNYNIRPGIDLQVSYNHFFTGDFIRNTGDAANAHLFYTQLSVKY